MKIKGLVLGILVISILGISIYWNPPWESRTHCSSDNECPKGYSCLDKVCKKTPPPEILVDLCTERFRIVTPCFVLGENVEVQAQIRNNTSNDNTEPFTVNFYISGNNIFGDNDDILVGSYRHTDQVPSGGKGPVFTTTLQTPDFYQDTYYNDDTNYIGMRIDSRGEVVETDEDNNKRGFPGSNYCRRNFEDIHNPFILPESASVTEGTDRFPQNFNRLVFQWEVRGYSNTCKRIKIFYRTEDGTASSNDDYLAAAGDTTGSAPIPINIYQDSRTESDEYFKLFFTVQNAKLLNPSRFCEDNRRSCDEYLVKGNIINDD